MDLLSPARVLTRVRAERVQIPGLDGALGILPGHAAMVSELGIGELVITGGELKTPERFFIAGGYTEVADDKVTVLVDVVERPKEIDVERAKKAKQRALETLARRTGDVDYPRAQLALKRAEQRLAFVGSASSASPLH